MNLTAHDIAVLVDAARRDWRHTYAAGINDSALSSALARAERALAATTIHIDTTETSAA